MGHKDKFRKLPQTFKKGDQLAKTRKPNAGGTPGTQEMPGLPGLPDCQPSTSSGTKYVHWPTTLQDMASPDNPPKIFAANG